MSPEERITALEVEVKNLRKDINELKRGNERIEEKLDKHLEKLSSLNARVAGVSFVIGLIVSGLIGFFFRKSGG